MDAIKHTPGPWTWGSGWADVESISEDEWYDSRPKYADLQLFGAGGEEILPLRIDHREPTWDTVLPLTPAAPDRALIAAAPELYDAAVAVMRLGRELDKAGIINDPAINALRNAIAKAEGSAT